MLLQLIAASSRSLAADGTYRAYVGTYTGGKSEGIYTFEFNAGTGSATKAELAGKTENPSFVAIHPGGKWLYAVSEVSDFRGEKAGAISAFAIDKASGKVTLLNQQSAKGTVTCHLVVDKGGKFVLAANYGSIGATIGHEITHAFDQSGSRFDAQGNLKNWWTDEDRSKFEALTKMVADQYSKIEVLPGVDVNGELTIGENIADMGGLQIAYDAFDAALKDSPAPGLIEGFTPDQRFFLSWAQSWRKNYRPEALKLQVNTDPHSPSNFRVVGPISNMDSFAKAFACKAGDKMVNTGEKQVAIW